MRDDYVLNITTSDGHGYSSTICHDEWPILLDVVKNKELNGFEVPFETLSRLWPKYSGGVEKVVIIKVK